MIKYISSLFIIFTIVACNYKSKTDSENTISINDAKNEIVNLERQLHSDLNINYDRANKIIGLYKDYVDNFPKDSMSPEYLFRASEVAIAINKYNLAVDFLTNIVCNYHNYINYELALFYLGYTYQIYVNDTASARNYYELFLHKYPNSTLANDVKSLLLSLGMTDIELIRKFEGNQ